MSMNLYNPDTNELTQVAGNGTVAAIIPDYNKAKEIGITTTVPYNVTEDGFVFGFFGNIDDDEGSFIRKLYVNDALAISSAGVVNISERVSFNIPFMIAVKKGDVVKLVGGSMYGEIRFCPPRKVLAPSSAIVDKVEEGNMNAVTSNAVAANDGSQFSDMNSITSEGTFYFRASKIINAPEDSYEDEGKLDATLEVVRLSKTPEAYIQTLRVAKSGRMLVYTRRIYNGSWSDWEELVTKQSKIILPGTTFLLDVTNFTVGDFTAYYYGGVAFKGGFVSNLYSEHSNVNLTFTTNNFENTIYFSVSNTQFKIINNSTDSIKLVYELTQ